MQVMNGDNWGAQRSFEAKMNERPLIGSENVEPNGRLWVLLSPTEIRVENGLAAWSDDMR